MKVTHLQNVRQIFHEKTHYLRNEFVASYFFLELFFLEYGILKKKSSFWTVVTIYPAWGLTHSGHTELVSKACQKNRGHFTEKKTTICEILEHICAATRWINDVRMATISSSMFFYI